MKEFKMMVQRTGNKRLLVVERIALFIAKS
jgi:hypothetical protein